MNVLRGIRVQKLFAIAFFLKVVSSFCGWYFQLQWSLGFVLPLLVMVAYIALGLQRHDRDVTDEKFADSCYYLGFIFTITSIVFSLFDLPNIGERIQDIAVRFGAAMVSTVLGLAVRVYLVSFMPDSSDALKDAEDAVLEAAQKFREQLVMAYEKLSDFQSQVTAATQTSVEAVKQQIEKLTQDHSARMERVFIELNERNQQAVMQALSEVRSASSRMAQSIDIYADGMKRSLQSLGDKVDSFGDAMTQRLRTTTFPDDYFASRLAAPLQQLQAASLQVSEQVQSAATSAGEAATVLTAAIRKLKTKATQAEESLDAVVRLTTAQHALFDTSAAQLERLEQLGSVLSAVQQALQASITASSATTAWNEDVRERVTAVVTAVEASQKAVVDVLGQFPSRMDAERDALTAIAKQIRSAEAATQELAQELRANSAMAQKLAGMLEVDASTRQELAAVFAAIQAQREPGSTVFPSLDNKAMGVSTEVAAAAPQLGGANERSDALMLKLVASSAPPANPDFGVSASPLSTPPTQPITSGPVLQMPPAQPSLDTVGSSTGPTSPVSYFSEPTLSSPTDGSGRGSGGGAPQR